MTLHHLNGAVELMPVEISFEIILILVVLSATIFLFVTELFRIDFTAITVMVLLGILNQSIFHIDQFQNILHNML